MVAVGPMKNPPHPGEIIREEVIRPLGLSVTAAAAALGVTRQALSAFLNERSDLSPETALRIEVAFGPKAEVMMAIQTDHAMAPPRAAGRRSRQRGRPGSGRVRRDRRFPIGRSAHRGELRQLALPPWPVA